MASAVARMAPGVNLGPADLIPLGEGRSFQVGDALIAVFRARGGQLFATQALCPHKRGPLADGIVGGGKVVCPLHAYRFDLATGRPVQNDCKALQTYPVHISEDGDIVVSLEKDQHSTEGEAQP